MKILFKNTTTYSEKIYQNFLHFHKEKFGLIYTVFTASIFFFILLLIILQINSNNYSLATLTIASLLSFLAWRYIRPLFLVKKDYESDMIQKQESVTFTFYENYFLVGTHNESIKTSYKLLYKAYQTNKYIYLYLNKKHAYILNKDCFEIGTNDEFISFLSNKLNNRFKKNKIYSDLD